MSQYVSHEAAAEALDSLDDYARMGTGVDAYGPRGMLERYIAQQAATLRQPAARVDVTEEMMSRACAAYDKRCPGLPMAPSAGIRAALEAALSAQPAPERQGVIRHVGDSLFESWFSEYDPSNVGLKQVARDSYAAGIAEQAERLSAHPAASVGVPDGFYLASFKHGPCGGYMQWWGPNNCGYTPDLAQAGIYSADQIKPGYHDSEYTVPVPVALIERFRIRRMLDVHDTLNAPLHSAEALRSWLAAAPSAPQGTQQGEGRRFNGPCYLEETGYIDTNPERK